MTTFLPAPRSAEASPQESSCFPASACTCPCFSDLQNWGTGQKGQGHYSQAPAPPGTESGGKTHLKNNTQEHVGEGKIQKGRGKLNTTLYCKTVN